MLAPRLFIRRARHEWKFTECLRTNDPSFRQSSGWNFRLLSIFVKCRLHGADWPTGGSALNDAKPTTFHNPVSHETVGAVYVIRRLITKGVYKIRGVYAKVERFTPQYSRAAEAARCGGVKAIKEVCPETVVYAAEVGYNQATVHKTTRQRYYCHLNGLSLSAWRVFPRTE